MPSTERRTGDGRRETVQQGAPAFTSPVTRPTSNVIRVACGALINAKGEALLAQRPEGKIAAGYWEFPGGKIEAGESPLAALARELHEEIGVDVVQARPLIRFTHHYSNRSIVLDTWLVSAWTGTPHGREEQALQWLRPEHFERATPLLPTVLPIASALRLPVQYVFTPEQASLAELLAGLAYLPAGALLRLRQPALAPAEYAARAAALLPAARAQGLRLVLDGDPALALRLGADGWHARAAELQALNARPPLPLCIASVHDAAELQQAQALGFDAAVAGPVQATATHPGAAVLGWQRFTELAGSAALPVYAIGGLGSEDSAAAFNAYAQGVAGIRAWWP